MDGVRVGKRIIGAEAPVTIGWENIPRVEGGPFKQLFFTWFQPAVLFGLIAFWFLEVSSLIFIYMMLSAIGRVIGFS